MSIAQIRGRCRIDEFTGCWLWSGAKSSDWPRIWAPDYTRHAGGFSAQTGRRAVWHIKTGLPIPDGWRVFGTCTEKTCCNPDHMICEPTAARGKKVAASGKLKNNITRITANRKTGRALSKLDAETRQLVRDSEEPGVVLAERYGCARQTISKIRKGQDVSFQPVGGMFTGLMGLGARKRAHPSVKVFISTTTTQGELNDH